MKKACLLVFCLAWVLGLSAQGKAAVIPLGSNVYARMESLYVESGESLVSNTYPWTYHMALSYLAGINTDRLSPAGKTLFESLRLDLNRHMVVDKDSFNLDVNIQVDAEAYGSSEAGRLAELKSYGDRPAFISIPLEVGLDDVFSMGGTVGFKGDYGVSSLDPWKYTNAVYDLTLWDWQLPFRAYGALGGEHWAVSLGRDQMQWGPGHVSQLLISDNADFYESLEATVFWDFFRYTMTYIDMEPWSGTGDIWQYISDTVDERKTYRSFFNHRFEIRPADFISFGINEGYMMDTLLPELKYFNPLMIFHSFTEWWDASSLFGFDLKVNPLPGVEVYGQIAWNQIQLAYEETVYDDTDMPNAMAYMLGLRGVTGIGPGLVNGGLEWAMTDPYMYLRESSNTSFVYRRKIFCNSTGSGVLSIVEEPMGFKYGNDAMTFAGWAGWEEADKYGFQLDWLTLAKGQMDLADAFDTGADAIALRTPTGIPWYMNRLSTYAWGKPLPWLTLDLELALAYHENYGDTPGNNFLEFDWTVGAGFDLLKLLAWASPPAAPGQPPSTLAPAQAVDSTAPQTESEVKP